MEHATKIEDLFRKYLNDQCSPEELQTLMDYFKSDDLKELMTSMIARMIEEESANPSNAENLKGRLDEVFRNIAKKKNGNK